MESRGQIAANRNDLELRHQLNETERKAWCALSQHKFMMFGYWVAVWVHLNNAGNLNCHNPFEPAVVLAREIREESGKESVNCLKRVLDKGVKHE